jgi:hypothetical protein
MAPHLPPLPRSKRETGVEGCLLAATATTSVGGCLPTAATAAATTTSVGGCLLAAAAATSVHSLAQNVRLELEAACSPPPLPPPLSPPSLKMRDGGSHLTATAITIWAPLLLKFKSRFVQFHQIFLPTATPSARPLGGAFPAVPLARLGATGSGCASPRLRLICPRTASPSGLCSFPPSLGTRDGGVHLTTRSITTALPRVSISLTSSICSSPSPSQNTRWRGFSCHYHFRCRHCRHRLPSRLQNFTVAALGSLPLSLSPPPPPPCVFTSLTSLSPPLPCVFTPRSDFAFAAAAFKLCLHQRFGFAFAAAAAALCLHQHFDFAFATAAFRCVVVAALTSEWPLEWPEWV